MKKILFILVLMFGTSMVLSTGCCDAKPVVRLSLRNFRQMMKKKSAVAAYKDPIAVQNAFAILYNRYPVVADTIANEISEYFYRDPKMQVALAKAYYMNNEREKTRFFVAKALARDSKFAPAYTLLGDMFVPPEPLDELGNRKAAFIPAEVKDSACVYYRKAVSGNPKYVLAYERYATTLARAKQLDSAKVVLQEMQAHNQAYSADNMYAMLSSKYDPNGKHDAWLATDPNTLSFNALGKGAQDLYWDHKYQESLERGLVGVKRFPGKRGRQFHRVVMWDAAQLGEFRTALEHGYKYFESIPKDSLTDPNLVKSIDWYSLGACEIALGDIDKGFEHWAQIAETHDDFTEQMDGKIRNFMASQLKQKRDAQDFEGALAMQLKYIEKYPSKKDPAYQIYTLASLYKTKIRYDKTREDSLSDIHNVLRYYKQIIDQYSDWSNIALVYYDYANITTRFIDQQNVQGLAIPYYVECYNTIDKEANPTDSEKNLAANSAYYAGFYYWKVKNDNKRGLLWFSNQLKYEPDNKQAKQIVGVLSPRKGRR